MGKATELSDAIDARSPSTAEIAARQAALEAGGQIEATLDGTLTKRTTPTESAREVMRAPQQTWD